MMPNADPVQSLFDGKSKGWNAKYAPGGPLAQRVILFAQSLATSAPPPAKVLDLGCGTGNLAAALAERGYNVIGTDIAEGMIRQARMSFPSAKVDWQLLPVNWTRLPVPDGSLDAVVSSSVFEYLPDLRHAFSECARVVRPGGYLLLTVPNVLNRVRRLERLIKPVAHVMAAVQPLGQIAALRRYADYLQLSQNRLTPDGWNAEAHRAGLGPAETPALPDAPPLVLLKFKKYSTG